MSSQNKHRYASWFSRTNDPKEDERILQPLIHTDFITLDESNFMLNMIRAMNHWLKVPEKQLEQAILVAQIMYAKDILIDDIQDNTEVRNKVTAAHLVYGIPHTINTIAYMIFILMEKLAYEFKDPLEVIKIHLERSMECLRGQWAEVEWRINGTVPTEEQYKANLLRKTGSPVLGGVLLLQHFSENKTDYSKYVLLLATFFQFHNDYINLTSKKYHETKGFCEDITEGKLSFPILHAIWSRPDDKRILNIMKQKTRDEQVKKYCLSLLEEFGSIEYARKTVMNLKDEILRQTKALGGNPKMVKVIEDHIASWE